jgi:hypothetical protein
VNAQIISEIFVSVCDDRVYSARYFDPPVYVCPSSNRIGAWGVEEYYSWNAAQRELNDITSNILDRIQSKTHIFLLYVQCSINSLLCMSRLVLLSINWLPSTINDCILLSTARNATTQGLE